MNDPRGSLAEAEARELFARGDERALQWLLDRMAPEVGPLLEQRFRGLLSTEELEEVISQALFQLWTHRGEYDATKGDLQGWFYVIARNRAWDLVRSRQRQATRLESALAVAPIDGEPGGPAAEAALARAFVQLNHRERLVVAPLFQNEGEPPTSRELGRKLKLSEGGVRALRFRGLRKLRVALAELGYCVVRRTARQ